MPYVLSQDLRDQTRPLQSYHFSLITFLFTTAILFSEERLPLTHLKSYHGAVPQNVENLRGTKQKDKKPLADSQETGGKSEAKRALVKDCVPYLF